MKQRLAIAQAVMEKPDVIMLDEPTNGLDDEGVEIIRRLILEEKERGALILLASHNSSDISLLTDIVYRIDNGKLREVKRKGGDKMKMRILTAVTMVILIGAAAFGLVKTPGLIPIYAVRKIILTGCMSLRPYHPLQKTAAEILSRNFRVFPISCVYHRPANLKIFLQQAGRKCG